MLIDIEKDIESNKDRMIKYFYDSVESDISSWKKQKSYYDEYLESPQYDNYYFKVDLNKKHVKLIKLNSGSGNGYNGYLIAKYSYFKNVKINRYVKYILNYIDNSTEMNFFQICVAAFEKIFIKETRKEKLEKIMKNT